MSQKGQAGMSVQTGPAEEGSAPESFRESYGVLQRHAETLRNQREPNIDSLLPIVTESMAAYKVCMERIDAVEKALEQALGQGAGVASGGAAGRPD